jgi:hypothetical protein
MTPAEQFLSFVRRLIFSFLLILLVATLSHAQNNGTVGIATGEIAVFTNQASGASSGGTWGCYNPATMTTPNPCAVFPDHGYAANYLTYCTTGFTGTIDLEWQPTGSATYITLAQASYSVQDNACHTLPAGGFFPNMRSTMTRITGSLSAWYTASAAPIPLVPTGLGSNGPSAPIVCDQTAIQTISTGNTSFTGAGPIQSTDTVVLCAFTISFAQAPTSGSLGISWAPAASSCALGGSPNTWQAFTTSATPQLFTVLLQQRSSGLVAGGDQYACFSNASGVNATISISYASVHGL